MDVSAAFASQYPAFDDLEVWQRFARIAEGCHRRVSGVLAF
jgi:hypothetical protein